MVSDTPYLPIADYAIIGDCGSAALISRHGTIDWLCLPQFDSSSIFAGLLDQEVGGCYYIRPTGAYEVERTYVGQTNVLKTTFTTETGTVELIDCMTVAESEAYDNSFWPDHEVLRAVTCTEGTVEIEVHCDPRFDYGRVQPRMVDRGALGYFFNYHSEVLVLRSELPLSLSEDGGVLCGTATLDAGDTRYIALTYDMEEPAVLPLLGEEAAKRIDDTIRYWQRWISRCTYDGPFKDAVARSALTLKLLTYARSGAVIAAPTTSLPEAIGGRRNWDYRYCWLRDAAFTLRVLAELGFEEEAEAFFSWLLYATGGVQPDLMILYDVFGGTHVSEYELDHLEGYRGSRPVRVGNGAEGQFQLDMYGEVVVAASEYVRRIGELDGAQRRILRKLGDKICERWDEKDNGIWEVRGERRHHTYSKAMCWVALDRLLQMDEHDQVDIPREDYEALRDRIREEIEARGYSEERQSYVSYFDGDTLDASLLLLAVYGYADAKDERMRQTFERIQEELAVDGLLYRYPHGVDDGFDSQEGAFGICSFWDEAIMALQGRVEDAKEHFEHSMSYANDLGLLSEEVDPETGELLGNFPQAFTHVGLINAALTIAAIEQDEDGAQPNEAGMEENLDETDTKQPNHESSDR